MATSEIMITFSFLLTAVEEFCVLPTIHMLSHTLITFICHTCGIILKTETPLLQWYPSTSYGRIIDQFSAKSQWRTKHCCSSSTCAIIAAIFCCNLLKCWCVTIFNVSSINISMVNSFVIGYICQTKCL